MFFIMINFRYRVICKEKMSKNKRTKEKRKDRCFSRRSLRVNESSR